MWVKKWTTVALFRAFLKFVSSFWSTGHARLSNVTQKLLVLFVLVCSVFKQYSERIQKFDSKAPGEGSTS